MKKQLIIIGILSIIVSIGLSGCNQESNLSNKEKDKFIGTWNGIVLALGIDEMTIILSSDSTVTMGTFSGTWEIKDGKLFFTFDDGGLLVFSYVFSNNDRTLTITDIDTDVSSVLTKQ
jgi:hypothetical protein